MDINLVREEEATPDIAEIYSDIKQSLKIPWLPLFFQAFAAYPPFLRFIWNHIKPSALTEQFRIDCERAMAAAWLLVSQRHEPTYKHEDALENDLAVDDLVDIQTTLEAFNYGAPKLLLISAALSRAVGGLTIGGGGNPELSHEHYMENVIQKIEIRYVDESQASENVKRIYEDIKTTTSAPVIAPFFMAIANWPGFLKLAWDDLKRLINSPAFTQDKELLFKFAEEAADRLAYPLKMGYDEMEAAGVHEEDFENIEEIIKFFASQIPAFLLCLVKMRLVTEDLLEVERGEYAA